MKTILMNKHVFTKGMYTALMLCILMVFSIQLLGQSSQELVERHLQQTANKYQLTTNDLADWIITSDHISSTSGVRHIYLRQRYEGIEIFGANASIHIKPNGELLVMHNQFIPNLEEKIVSTSPSLSAINAVEKVANEMNYSLTEPLQIKEDKRNVAKQVILSNGGISRVDIPVKLMYQSDKNGKLHLSWNMSISEVQGTDWWNIRANAQSGKILDKSNWVVHCEFGNGESPEEHALHAEEHAPDILTNEMYMPFNPDSYRVFALPDESPQHGAMVRTLQVNPANATASPFGWHDTDGAAGAEFTITRGNNVFAYDDIADTDSPGSSPDGTGSLDFDFPVDFTMAPVVSLDAATTNLFYWNNIIHDILYQYGFDEAGGNFQENNYGNGGAGSDGVNAESQDGEGLCNANFGTPNDGSNPRMQMFLCDNTSPSRDGSFDNLVIVHEYAHGISNRLVGGPGDTDCLRNDEQMGEGWSDWYGMMLTMQPGHVNTTNRDIATYLFGGAPQSGGIRARFYTTDMSVNEFTYDRIKLTGGSPHALGHVWATMLWDLTWQLMCDDPYDADFYNGTGGNNVALNLITEAMKLTPCSPGFVDSRDAILAADNALYGGAYNCKIWRAFARRGLGTGAQQGDTDSRTDGTEDFTSPYGTPTIICPANVSRTCNQPTDPGSTGTATVSGFCSPAPTPTFSDVSTQTNNGSCTDVEYTITRTWSATDCMDQTFTCVQIITVTSPNGPTIICPANATVECLSDIVLNPNNATVTTDCGLAFNTVISGPVQNGPSDCPGTTYTYTYTVTDGCGRMASCPQVFTIQNDGPVITCPADMVVECFSDIVVNPNDAAVVTSCNMGFNTVITGPVQVGQSDCPGTTYTYTYTTTDACGRTDDCEQVFTIDNEGPMIICPPDFEVACEDEIMLDPNDAMVTTSCGLTYAVYIKNPYGNGAPGCNGTVYEYIYKVVDECGRTAACSQFVTIVNTPATISAPAGGIVTCFEDISISVDDATVNNDCADYNLYLVPPVANGEVGCPGTTYTYTYRLIDVCGNVVEEPTVYTNGANAGPTITAPADVTCSCLAGITPNPDNAAVTTSCTIGSTVTVTGPQVFGPIDCPNTVYRYTYTATDDCGRTATDTQDFTVSNGPPVFYNCPGDNWLVLNCEDYGGEAGTIQVIEAWIASVTASTSCGLPLTVFNNFNSNNINTCINNGYNTVTFRATDNCGRTSFCTGVYVVVDTEAPTIITPAQDHWEMCNYNTQANLTAWVQARGGAVASDGCSGDNISWQASPANPQINCIGAMGTTSVTVQFIVTDNCGNKTNTTATFNALMAPGNDLNDGKEDHLKEEKGMILLQNRPNPFKDETLIGFNLPEATFATLTIFDVNGRALKVIEGNYNEGYNEIQISRSDLSATGIMYYRLMTNNGSVTKMMLLID
jgi:fungalysin metallopeptidase (M36)/fungalysin/thermolysin propeptide